MGRRAGARQRWHPGGPYRSELHRLGVVSNSGPAFLRALHRRHHLYRLPAEFEPGFSFPIRADHPPGIAKTLARARLDQLRASNNFGIDVSASTRRRRQTRVSNRSAPMRSMCHTRSTSATVPTSAWRALQESAELHLPGQDRQGLHRLRNNNTTVTVLSNIGEFSTPINGTGGNIKGFEYSASLPLNPMMPQLDGFGVVASHSDTKSGIKPNGPNGGTQPLPGIVAPRDQPDRILREIWLRPRQRERSDFQGEVTGFGADREFPLHQGRKGRLPAGYAFEQVAQGLSILFQVNNANNEPYRTYDGVPIKPNQYTVYGRTTLLGVNYKF